jgi:hypothetical protein
VCVRVCVCVRACARLWVVSRKQASENACWASRIEHIRRAEGDGTHLDEAQGERVAPGPREKSS